jgi:hypothetical protein
MSHGVIIANKIRATDSDALNRVAVSADDVDNGFVFELLTRSTTTGESEVWTATKSGGTLTNIWMAKSPGVVSTVSGSNEFLGLDSDIRNFYKIAGKMIDCFRPMVGDIITLTSDALGGTKASASYTHVVVTSGTYKLTWATGAVNGLSLAWLATTTISIPSGTISDVQQVTAYKFAVSAIS